jgi:hypothetical protein
MDDAAKDTPKNPVQTCVFGFVLFGWHRGNMTEERFEAFAVSYGVVWLAPWKYEFRGFRCVVRSWRKKI